MNTLLRLLVHLRHHRTTVVAAMVCSVLNKLWDLAPPVLIGMAVDVVVKRDQSFLASVGFTDPNDQLLLLAALTVAVWGLESVFEYLYAVLWRNLAQAVQHELRLEAWTHIQELDMDWFSDQSVGGLMSVLNDDVNQLERFLDGGANDILQIGTTAVVVSAAFFYVSPEVAVWAIAPVPFVLGGSLWFQTRVGPRYVEVRERVADLSARLSATLDGIATVKAFTAEKRERALLEATSQSYAEANRAAIRVSAAFVPLIRMVIVVGFTATLVIGGHQALAGTLDVGSYSVLVFLTQRLLWPLTGLGNTLDLYQRAMASTRRILDLIDTKVQIVSGDKQLDRSAVRGALHFRNVHFHYADRERLFEGLSLDIPAGKTVAVVGATGSGKTTLVRLLLRFHDPEQGEVTLDGEDIRDFDLPSLRGAIGLVSQHVTLFPGTLRDNLRYGRPDASDEAIEAACRAAEAWDFIETLPQGLDTQVGDRGQKLSGGQRQRVAIARAVLEDAPVLVLDEATSAVDNETEAALQRSMARLAENRTTLVIAHRLSTVRHAHRIVVLDHGKLVESGTHNELVAAKGIYARLWAVQTGDRT